MITTQEKQLVFKIRFWIIFFIFSLVVWGITTFPLETELKIISRLLGISPDAPPEIYSGLKHWIATVQEGLLQTNFHYPFLLYGTDWLAFSHLVIAVAFIGLYVKPIRNKWIIYFGMIACIGVIPLALICGMIRGIPFYWRLVDCSFGIFGLIPLNLLHIFVKKLEIITNYRDGNKY